MTNRDSLRLTRRERLKLGAGGAGMFALTASGLAIPRGIAGSGGGSLYIEAFPTSPLVLSPFNEALPIPTAMAPIAKAVVDGWASPPGPDNQDLVEGAGGTGRATPWKHQLWPGQRVTASYPWQTTTPAVYHIKLQVSGHSFTSSLVQPINSLGRNTVPPGAVNANPRKLPQTPVYDPVLDNGDETRGLRLPGVRRNNPDGSFDVDYDIPLAFYDVRLDDGVTPHKDAHTGSGETHPEWWGKSYFRHLPNHGFVGDIFTVNGKAYPVLEVKRRKYRLRFLDASIARIYDFKLMHSSRGPKSARDLGYSGDDLQGQWRLTDGQQCMKFVQIANEGGLLPKPIVRDSFELWPAKRKEVIVDFTRYMDGTPTRKGDEIYLVNTMKMTSGRMWDSADPAYRVAVMKIVIGDDAADASLIPATLRPAPDLVPGAAAAIADKGIPTFELQRGSATGQPETEWLINGLPFDETRPLITVNKDSAGMWRIRNGGGGWVHPMHLHQEEHRVVARNGKLAPTGRHPDDTAKEDVIALDPSEEVVISRRFRTFVGPYVAHCHNLAHEDHSMMFGWEIAP